MLLFTGVFRPPLWWVCSSPSKQFSRSQLDRRKGVFERDLDLNSLTVGFSIFLSLILPRCYHYLYTIFTPRFQRSKVDDLTKIPPKLNLIYRIFNTCRYCTRKSISVASCDAAKSNVTNVSVTFSYTTHGTSILNVIRYMSSCCVLRFKNIKARTLNCTQTCATNEIRQFRNFSLAKHKLMTSSKKTLWGCHIEHIAIK